MSRPRKYQTEDLISIVDSYIMENQVGQIKAADLARYAVKELEIDAMDGKNGGRFFSNDKDVMEYIKRINHYTPNYLQKDGQALIEFNPEKFIELYKNDSKVQMAILRSFADSYNDSNRKIIAMKAAEVNYKSNIEKLKIENKKLKEKLKEQSEVLNKRNLILKNYKAIKHFVDNVNMLEYLKSKGSFLNINEETFLIILNKMESIIGSVLKIDSEIKNDFDEVLVINESSDINYKFEDEKVLEANKLEKSKLIDFVEEKTKKNNEVSNLLAEYRNKTT
jgi:hypothetical protein